MKLLDYPTESYGLLIDTALYVMLLMRENPLRGHFQPTAFPEIIVFCCKFSTIAKNYNFCCMGQVLADEQKKLHPACPPLPPLILPSFRTITTMQRRPLRLRPPTAAFRP
jgi:hypothetical protein